MIAKLLINVIAFYVVSYIIPGVKIANWQALLVLAVVWGVLAAVIRPILVFLTLPINIVTLGLFVFVINAGLLLVAAKVVEGFEIADFTTSLLAAVVLAILNIFLSKLTK
jgi:putative membrane protein